MQILLSLHRYSAYSKIWGSLFTFFFFLPHRMTCGLLVLCGCSGTSVMSDCDPMPCKPTRLRCPWNSAGKNAGVSYSLLLGIFPTHQLNLCLLHCRWILFFFSHKFMFYSRNKEIAGGFFTTEPPGKPFLSPDQGSNPHPCSGSTES